MQKVLLYYKFVPIADPETVRLWQRSLCENLGLKGRILIADHGINGTVGGELNDLKQYVKQTRLHPAFKDVVFKWSDGGNDDFPKLVIKVRPEIVTFGIPNELKVDDSGVIGGGKRLKPEQLHDLIRSRGEDVVFFDGRNTREAAIGKFKNAVVPDVKYTRDFKSELKKPKYDKIKNKPVVAYCTGGIRCEVLSTIMKQEGFEDVYQIDGGIVKYGEKYGDEGLWEGALYVFDNRIATKFSDNAKDIGVCVHCKTKTSNYENCSNVSCNKHFIACQECAQKGHCPDCLKTKAKAS